MSKMISLLSVILLTLTTAVSAQTWNQKGHSSFMSGDAEKAEQDFEEALRVNPFDPIALNNLAVARAEQGDYHAALTALERAHGLAPNNRDIHHNMVRMRGWVNVYAGNDQSILLGEGEEIRTTPPAPPAIWD